ncbi:uncharacterized protein LOC124128384 [Haliotis rufescens]|uniref:uncharacterized protein LOC124128384 n=1 Tax=Haliotis rufescens TaxID=6454 RepID=UPI00201E9405|nr:uncharacterized protein LOC124128384 [Haliotis rufescens]
MSGENSESKASSGDIHHSEGTPGDNHEVQMAYDEVTDDGSSLGSSPYQSDEEIIKSLFAQENDSTSSSDDQEPLHADFPSGGISKGERNLILDQTDLKRATDPGHRIFPQSAKKYLELSLQNPGGKVDVISREIQNVLHQHVGWAYVAHQMAHTDKFECRKLPTISICDVAIIRATQPLHILTFVEDGGKQEHAVEYNAQLTRSTMGFIKEETGVSLDVVYGVVPASTWKDEKMFKEKLERIETVARRKALPGYLHMDTERYTAITNALVDLYSEPGLKVELQPQEDPPNPVSGEAEPGVSQTDTMQQGEDLEAARRDTSRDQFINACRFGDLETVRAAMGGLDVNGAGSNGVTPLRASIENRRFTVMEFLVEKEANPTLVDGEGRNILHLASIRGDKQKVEFILSLKKMDINAKDNESMTAADLARHWKNEEVVGILSSHMSITGYYSSPLPPQGRNPRQTGYLVCNDQQWDAGDTFDPGSPQGCKLHTMQEAERLRKKFLEHKYDKEGKLICAKIFIFGPGGAGMSSFCNGLRSALKGSDTPSNYYTVRNLDCSLTGTFQATQYGDHSIIDMPGIFGSSAFKMEDIEAIASGMVGHEAQITKTLDVKGGLSQQKARRDVSCAVPVLNHGITLVDELKRQIDTIIGGYGALSYHLVLTHLDECDPQFEDQDNLPNLYTSPLVQKAVKNMSEQTGIPGSNISYVKNYVTETETDTNTKLLHLRALDGILTSTADQVEKMIDNKLQKKKLALTDWAIPILICAVGILLSTALLRKYERHVF